MNADEISGDLSEVVMKVHLDTMQNEGIRDRVRRTCDDFQDLVYRQEEIDLTGANISRAEPPAALIYGRTIE